MSTLKSGLKITCTSIEDARLKQAPFSNALIVVKDNSYLLVNYKTYEQLKAFGYTQVR